MDNEIRLIGNVVYDPDLFEAKNGNKFAKLRMVTNKKFGNDERSCFINVKLFGRAFGDFEYFDVQKGDKIVVDGELVQEDYEKDGEKRTAYVVYANNLVKVHRKTANQNTSDSSF